VYLEFSVASVFAYVRRSNIKWRMNDMKNDMLLDKTYAISHFL